MLAGGFAGHFAGDPVFSGFLNRVLLGTGNTNYYSNVSSTVFNGLGSFLKEDVNIYDPVVSPQGVANEDEDPAAIFIYPIDITIDELKDSSAGLSLERATIGISPTDYFYYPNRTVLPFFADCFLRSNKHSLGRNF